MNTFKKASALEIGDNILVVVQKILVMKEILEIERRGKLVWISFSGSTRLLDLDEKVAVVESFSLEG